MLVPARRQLPICRDSGALFSLVAAVLCGDARPTPVLDLCLGHGDGATSEAHPPDTEYARLAEEYPKHRALPQR